MRKRWNILLADLKIVFTDNACGIWNGSNVISDRKQTIVENCDPISDKDAYRMLLEDAIAMNQQEELFLMATYVLGTYTCFDSPAERFDVIK